jgi:hypothetical protein
VTGITLLLLAKPKPLSVSRNYPGAYLNLAAALAQLGRLDKARSAAKAGLAVNPAFTVSRTHRGWTAMSDDTTYLAQLERRLLGGLRKAGLPDGDKIAILRKPAVQPQCPLARSGGRRHKWRLFLILEPSAMQRGHRGLHAIRKTRDFPFKEISDRIFRYVKAGEAAIGRLPTVVSSSVWNSLPLPFRGPGGSAGSRLFGSKRGNVGKMRNEMAVKSLKTNDSAKSLIQHS